MPTYAYQCEKDRCATRVELFFRLVERPEAIKCPACKARAPQTLIGMNIAVRGNFSDVNRGSELYGDCGIADLSPAARKAAVRDGEIVRDRSGRAQWRFKSRSHQDKVLAKHGLRVASESAAEHMANVEKGKAARHAERKKKVRERVLAGADKRIAALRQRKK